MNKLLKILLTYLVDFKVTSAYFSAYDAVKLRLSILNAVLNKL